MSSTSTNVYRVFEKTSREQSLQVNSTELIAMDFPVYCNGIDDSDSWELNWSSSREEWKNDKNVNLYTYKIKLSGKQTKIIKYDKRFYEIIIRYYISNNPYPMNLVNETKEMIDPNQNHFEFAKQYPFWGLHIIHFTVQVGLKLYYSDSPQTTSLKRMLDRGRLTDAVIKTKGKDFPCHKLVLASESEYFDKMFEVDMREKKESVVNWVDVFEADVVEDLLHYLYNGQTTPNFANTCLTLLEIAHMGLMDGLKTLCFHQLKKTINVENMGDILKLAIKNEFEELTKMAVNFMVRNYDFQKGESPAPWDQLEPNFGKSLTITMLKAMAADKLSFTALL